MDDHETLVTLAADIVSAHVSNNSASTADLPTLIRNVHSALASLSSSEPEAAPKQEPAVSVRASVKPDFIVCLEDGKKLKILKRHLMTHYNMTPDGYRAKWNLPADYPMMAPNYAEQRRILAVNIGLGRNRKGKSRAKKSRPLIKVRADVRLAGRSEQSAHSWLVSKAAVRSAGCRRRRRGARRHRRMIRVDITS